jgi:TadE-like protein
VAQRSPAGGVHRRGIASVEMALLLPLLAFIFVAGVDFARAFYYGMALDGCARNGALFGRISAGDPSSPFATVEAAVLSDAAANGLSPAPTVAVGYGSAAGGPYTSISRVSPGYVQVTVSWPFTTLSRFPGVPSETTLTRTCRMPVPAGSPVSN